LKLLLEFGNLQDGEELPLRHVRPLVDIKLLDIAGDFSVDVDLLKRLEFRGDFESAGDAAADSFDNRYPRGA